MGHHIQTRVLQGVELGFLGGAQEAQDLALQGKASVVRIDELVFFSTETGDAWMLDPADRYATCLARAFEPRPIPIAAIPDGVRIQWQARYAIDGEAFSIVDRDDTPRTFDGYPASEIQSLTGDIGPASDIESAMVARARLKAGRNAPCLCGSGRKYKKCCLQRDELLARESVPLVTDFESPDDAFTVLESADHEDFDAAPESEEERTLDALWEDFEALESPSPEQADAFLNGLLALPPEATRWSRVFDALGAHKHIDLPRVFRRIADAVPPSRDAHMGFFYWNAADEFVRRGRQELLPEVASRLCALGDAYDPDALWKIMDILLAEELEAETLALAEHFLPIMRADDRLMPWAVPDLCGPIFELRVGRGLREEPDMQPAPEALAGELRRGLEDEIEAESAENAAAVITGQATAPAWTRAEFELPRLDSDSDEIDERGWQEIQRLRRLLIHVAGEAWQTDQRPPGSMWRTLLMLCASMYKGTAASPRKQKARPLNLLDCLRPAGIEPRVVGGSLETIGIDVPRARLLLDAHQALLRCAKRHGLISRSAAGRSANELRRVRHSLSTG